MYYIIVDQRDPGDRYKNSYNMHSRSMNGWID